MQRFKRGEVTVIIPAAGKGTRMGSPKDGKEMMIDPRTGEPLINWPIKEAIRNGFKVAVIISKAKKVLASHIRANFPNTRLIIHEANPWDEWPTAVTVSYRTWSKYNLLVLPDTRFSPADIGRQLLETLRDNGKISLAFATIPVQDGSKYGIIQERIDDKDFYYTSEKCRHLEGKPGTAWGLIAFTKPAGWKLFQTYKTRSVWLGIKKEATKLLPLEAFKDITRNGKIEEY